MPPFLASDPSSTGHLTPAWALPLDDSQSRSDGSDLGLSEKELSSATIAMLVRRRLRQNRAQGGAIIFLMACSLGLVWALLGVVRSELLVTIYASAMASTAIGLGFLVDRAAYQIFANAGRAQGLSDNACRRLFAGAAAAETWLEVLRECGAEPTDDDVARFVRSSIAAKDEARSD